MCDGSEVACGVSMHGGGLMCGDVSTVSSGGGVAMLHESFMVVRSPNRF